MSKKLITEMQSVLGHEIKGLPSRSQTPREVIGTFVVQGGGALDEVAWDEISKLEWNEIADTAMLTTIQYDDFNKLSDAYEESSSEFRAVWNELSESGKILPTVNLSAFISVLNTVENRDYQARYVYWCARTLHEADDKVKAKFGTIIPVGPEAQHAKGVVAAQKYMTPHEAETDRPDAGQEVMRNAVFHGQDDSKAPPPEMSKSQGMANVIKAQDMMTKIAADHGMPIDRAFNNLFRDLARERARNS